jgi:hypothetical protein
MPNGQKPLTALFVRENEPGFADVVSTLAEFSVAKSYADSV